MGEVAESSHTAADVAGRERGSAAEVDQVLRERMRSRNLCVPLYHG